ncbi:MAG: hypothetical protein DRP34_03895 [Thermodesulfobacteriota bacterium]|nr:MAG: hypothetical protein DRP34_03895 [Thermodesulfobacteriota bacterium]
MNKSVLIVGGLDRLVNHYKEIARAFKCQFYHHCGDCNGGKKKLYRLVDQADVIFCSININSHTACALIKKRCKKQGKPFFFLKSSGLSYFKKVLEEWLEKQKVNK